MARNAGHCCGAATLEKIQIRPYGCALSRFLHTDDVVIEAEVWASEGIGGVRGGDAHWGLVEAVACSGRTQCSGSAWRQLPLLKIRCPEVEEAKELGMIHACFSCVA